MSSVLVRTCGQHHTTTTLHVEDHGRDVMGDDFSTPAPAASPPSAVSPPARSETADGDAPAGPAWLRPQFRPPAVPKNPQTRRTPLAEPEEPSDEEGEPVFQEDVTLWTSRVLKWSGRYATEVEDGLLPTLLDTIAGEDIPPLSWTPSVADLKSAIGEDVAPLHCSPSPSAAASMSETTRSRTKQEEREGAATDERQSYTTLTSSQRGTNAGPAVPQERTRPCYATSTTPRRCHRRGVA